MSSFNCVRVREDIPPFSISNGILFQFHILSARMETLFSADIPRFFALKEILAFDLISHLPKRRCNTPLVKSLSWTFELNLP
jgi:hypothetical protein